MLKKAIILIMSTVIVLCFLGCSLEDRALSLSDSRRELISYQDMKVKQNLTVSALPPVNMHIEELEKNTWAVTCFLNNVVIQEYNNLLPAFGNDITFEYNYVNKEGYMPYYYEPSTAKTSNKDFPLIVWLHGSGEKDVAESDFKRAGLPAVLDNWSLCGFNAYIFCPQLGNGYNNGAWCNTTSQKHFQTVLDKFILEHNIDSDKIIICGHSLGGQGCLYMAHQMPNYFKGCISFSPYAPGIDISEITIPVIGYSEAGLSMARVMQEQWGEDCVRYLNTGHGFIPRDAWNLDENNNNCSDVVEWMFEQFK